MGELHFDHVSLQTGGPRGVVGAHREQYLSTAALDPVTFPHGLADGHAHIARIVYTPGFSAEKLGDGPSAASRHLQYWVHEGGSSGAAFPHTTSIGSWARPGVGMLQVYVDDLTKPLLSLPIDIAYTLGLKDGRAWAGLTAATGRRFQNHYVLGWQFCEGAQGCEVPMTSCEAYGCNPTYPSARYGGGVGDTDGVSSAHADLAQGVPPRPRVNGMGQRTGGASAASDVDELPDAEWGAEPAEWKTVVEPMDDIDIWGGTGSRFAMDDNAEFRDESLSELDEAAAAAAAAVAARPYPSSADGLAQPFLGGVSSSGSGSGRAVALGAAEAAETPQETAQLRTEDRP